MSTNRFANLPNSNYWAEYKHTSEGTLIERAKEITLRQALDYEIRSSWWASFISGAFGQHLAGKYFSNKVSRKHRRYLKSKENEKKVLEILSQLK